MCETLNLEVAILDLARAVENDDISNAGSKSLYELFKQASFEEIFNQNQWLKTADSKSLLEIVKEKLNESQDVVTQVYYLGVAALQVFVQKNWLGVQMPNDENYNNLLNDDSKKELTLDGECFYPTVKGLPFLYLAKIILHDLHDCFKTFKLSDWWLIRYISVHQRALEEPSQLLNAALIAIVERSNLMFECLENDMNLSTLLQLEIGYAFLLYGEVQKTKTHFERANQSINFQVEWTGALGKRTRYQQTALPQLTIRVRHESARVNNQANAQNLNDFPRDVKLDDDTRLNQISFVDSSDNVLPELDPVHQALLIAQATQLEKFKPKDDLLAEEIAPVLNCIIGHPKVWSFHFSALLIRSLIESNQSRAVERSMTQLQELADALGKPAPRVDERLKYFYVSRLPLESEVLKSLAEVLHSLGAINSSLDIYLRLQAWDGVISCYQTLEMKHKAEEIVRQELAKEESPKLWCLLGNCTDDVACYEKAWELSKHTSARAQRDWAFYYYSKRQYTECIAHFQESLKVNSLQEGVWIRLAFCAMEIEDFETAAAAYRRYCMLNSECFEAWNNVAKCYVKLGQKSRAWKALQEAVKCNFENWKVWDNLMVVSVDCCEYEEVIRAYNRILDLKEKHVDAEVLKILVQAIVEDREDNYGEKVGRLASSAHKLLGRITSQVTNHAGVWEAYADLVHSDAFRNAQFLQKAYRSAVQEKNWEKEVESCLKTLKLSCKFIESCLTLLAKDCSKDNQQLAISAKLSLRSTISQVKRCYEFETPESISQQLELMEKLQKDLTTSLSPQS